MSGAVDDRLLAEVSRSFALSIRLLPGPMRWPVGVAYLLARASDTLADTATVPAARRIALLDGFAGEIAGEGGDWRDAGLGDFRDRQEHPGERRLIERLDGCFAALESLPEPQRAIVREVVDVILSGQKLDLQRFAEGPGVLASDAELSDYCWRVAGCVGRFWTRIGFATLGNRFSGESPEQLEERGIRYGKGLQLVNILRDLPGDLANGRCYLPVADPSDREALLVEAAGWRDQARRWLGDGERYASALTSRRLRAASVLPALIGERTLSKLDGADWETLEAGVKVSRGVVRRCLLRALFW